MIILAFLLFGQLNLIIGYDDLSFNKSTAQGAIYSCPTDYCERFQSRSAVDRSTVTCTRTQSIGPSSGSETTWWYVDLGGIYNVYKIRIIFKDYGQKYELRQRGRFAGFSLYLSNSSSIDDGLLCYKDGPNLPLLDVNLTCSGFARYVFFHNERLSGVTYPDGYQTTSYTELCEVIVLGCPEGVYGFNCDLSCPVHCQGNRCDIVNGTCYECKLGWQEEFCDQECTSGSYGVDCKSQCSGHCANSFPCDHVTGECPDECAAGWTGKYCNKPCDFGKYGPNCIFICSGHCMDNATCNRETGHCDTGCNGGYKGKFCSEACAMGTFGNGCGNICSGHCLNNETCSPVNGICRSGCATGYYGSFCSTVCPDGSYGLNCSGTCSRNCIGTCGNVDGFCKCVPGFTGSPNCTMACAPGFYGINCQYKCSGQCVNGETCSRYDGSCSLGCKENYVGLACDFFRDGSVSASTVGLAVIVAVYSICLMTAFIFFYLRRRHGIILKERKPQSTPKDMMNVQSSTPQTTHSNDDTHNYQELDVSKDKNSYELLHVSENTCAYQNLEHTS